MITVIVTFIAAHIGTVIGALAALLGVGWGAFKHQQANTAIANAKATVAANNAEVDKSNAAASAAGAQSIKNAADAQKAATGTPDADIDAQLAALRALRDDK